MQIAGHAAHAAEELGRLAVHHVSYLWLIPLFPLVGAAINALFGWKLQQLFGKQTVHRIAVGGDGRSPSRSAVCAFSQMLALPAEERFLQNTLWNLLTAGRLTVDLGVRARPALHDDGADHHRHRHAHPRLLDRLHGRRAGLLAVLLVPEPLRLRDAAPGHGGQLRADVLRLGGRRPRLLPAHRLLVHRPREGRGRHEGLRRQPLRRLRLPRRPVPALLGARRRLAAPRGRRCARPTTSRTPS